MIFVLKGGDLGIFWQIFFGKIIIDFFNCGIYILK